MTDEVRRLLPPDELVDALRTGDRFLIATHVNPDGDALGSALGLAEALMQLGKQVWVLDRDPVPEQYRFMPGCELIHSFESLEAAGFTPGGASTLLIVDCNEPARIGLDKSAQTAYHEKFKAAVSAGWRSIVIDHHETVKPFGDIKWIVPEAAATGLMIVNLIKALGAVLTSDIAVNLYAAIAIDTGNFRYRNATAPVFRVAAELIEAGARPADIYQELYESWSDGRFDLYLKVIATLERHDDIVVTVVTRQMLEETGTSPDDTETFVSFPRVLKRVAVSVLLRETGPDEYKVSLRSKGDLNVATIAASLGGGGHKNAAGCRIRGDLAAAKKNLVERIKALQQG